MGTGGATALLSPDSGTGVAVRRYRGEFKPMSKSGDDVDLSKNCWFVDIYIQSLGNTHFKASFYFEIFCSPLFAVPLARNGLTEK
jgi:hypothetical protein